MTEETELKPLTTLIVDDEPLAIERLQLLCARQPDINLIGTASDGEAALRLTEQLKPDLQGRAGCRARAVGQGRRAGDHICHCL